MMLPCEFGRWMDCKVEWTQGQYLTVIRDKRKRSGTSVWLGRNLRHLHNNRLSQLPVP